MKNTLQPINESRSLQKTIIKLMSQHDINMNQLHKKTGVPLTTINRIVNEENLNPTVSSLIPIASFFGITLNQLMGIDPLENTSAFSTKKTIQWSNVPLITWEEAPKWESIFTKDKETIATNIKVSNNAFALIITETNLEGFFPNSIIIIDTHIKPDHGDFAVVHKKGQPRASLKQILIDDDTVYLRPLNKEYQTQIANETYQVIGTVVQIRNDRIIK